MNLESLKTVDRTIAIGNRRVVITFDGEGTPIINSGILPGDYLCWSRKKGWYCSASADNPDKIEGIFIDDEGNYMSVNALKEPPCQSHDINLYNMPPLRVFRKIESIRETLNNSLTAAGFEILSADLLTAFWSCDDRFYNRRKRPLLIKSYRELCKKYQIKKGSYLDVKGTVVRTIAEEGGAEIDLLKAHKLLLVNTGGSNSSNQAYWVLYEFAPNNFYVLQSKLFASAPLRQEDYKKLLSMPEVIKRRFFPEAEMKSLMFTYEDGTQSEQVEEKKMLGIPYIFKDGARAIVRPYPFVCFSFDEFKQICSKLVCFQDKNWSFSKREHLVELAHSDIFNALLHDIGIDANWRSEWAYNQSPSDGDIADTWMVPVVSPYLWDVDDAYERTSLPSRTYTTLNDCIRVLFVMYM